MQGCNFGFNNGEVAISTHISCLSYYCVLEDGLDVTKAYSYIKSRMSISLSCFRIIGHFNSSDMIFGEVVLAVLADHLFLGPASPRHGYKHRIRALPKSPIVLTRWWQGSNSNPSVSHPKTQPPELTLPHLNSRLLIIII